MRSRAVKKDGVGCEIRIERASMKKLIPFVLGVWVIALVGCTTTTTTTPASTTTTTTTRQTNASLDPTISNTRTSRTTNRGPR